MSGFFNYSQEKVLLVSLLLIFTVISSLNINCWAANTGQSISPTDLAALEIKLFHKAYDNDPPSKRLQRLELLTFGTTQYGSNLSRWHNIERYLRNKSNGINNGSVSLNSGKERSVSNSLSELEKYVFKATAPTENTSRRLDKLETKLFGKPSANMPAEQRVSRLERTLGLSRTPEQMAEVPYSFSPHSMSPFNTMPYMHPFTPGVPSPFGFNNDDLADPGFNQLESQMSQMLGEMQRQMQEQQGRLTPTPHQMPFFGTPQLMPRAQGTPAEKIPAYNDPNFI